MSEGQGFLVKVFREAGSMTVASEGFFAFFESGGELPSVCPMYVLLQSGQVILYTPDSENLSGAGCL